jgi:phage repressor protein C with HTH and peptisase S24 domain
MALASETREPSALYRLLISLKPDRLSEAEWARLARVSSSFFQDVKKGRRPRSDNLEKVVQAIGMTPAQFYALEGSVRTEVAGLGLSGVAEVQRHFHGAEPLPGLPLYGSAVGGEYGNVEEHIELTELHLSETLDYLIRPASLANDPGAYALMIVGDSMVPRFKPGEQIAVSPKASIGIGDDVIVQLRDKAGASDRISMVLIKELVRRTASHYELKQYNPEITFRVPKEQVAAMHKVKGHYF